MRRRSLRDILTAQRIASGVTVVLVIYVVLWAVHPSLLFSGTTIDGGDTGSHVATALFLRQHWSGFDLTPWDPGWFNGLPLYTYYFVLPDALAAAASYVINFAVAFKLMTLLGSVLMPVAAYVMARLFRAPHPIPAACAGVMLPFLFDSSYTIDGGNLFSTFAGEYAFSLSLALSLVTIGLFARGLRTGRGRWLAAVFLSLTLAAHILPWLYAIGVVGIMTLVEVLDRRGWFDAARGPRRPHHGRRAVFFVGSAGLISLGLSAWWLLPFVTSQAYTTNMGYVNDPTSSFSQLFTDQAVNGNTGLVLLNASGGLSGDAWVIIGALCAAVLAFYWRDRLGITLALTAVASACAFIVDPQGAVWNERLVPFWIVTDYLLVGWLAGSLALRVARWWSARASTRAGFVVGEDDELIGRVRDSHVVVATYAIAVATLLSTVPGLVPWMANAVGVTPGPNQVTNWATYNYEGYQDQPGWPEFHSIITTMDQLTARYGCGRAMWEYDSDEGRFGTPEALMTLPYWTNNCVGSEEGLLFESSATTPYHFLDQAEFSAYPSDPEVGLHYGTVDVALGVRHLQMLGVKYFFGFSSTVVAQADRDPSLIPIAVIPKSATSRVAWHFYLIRNSALVTPVHFLPNVVDGTNGRAPWLAENQDWWLDPNKWPVLYAASGPASWPHHPSGEYVYKVPVGTTTVSHIVSSSQAIAFDVSRVGVPVVVKISYFPRWHATGALGPYRVSPNLMVVIPTSTHVQLTYTTTPALWWGNVVTDLTVLALIIVAWRARRWRRPLSRARR